MAAGELQVTGGFESADHEWTPCCGRDDPRSTVKGQIPEHGLGQRSFLRPTEVTALLPPTDRSNCMSSCRPGCQIVRRPGQSARASGFFASPGISCCERAIEGSPPGFGQQRADRAEGRVDRSWAWMTAVSRRFRPHRPVFAIARDRRQSRRRPGVGRRPAIHSATATRKRHPMGQPWH